MTDSKKLAEAVLVKRRLLNSCFYLGASSVKLGLLKDAAAAILPSLTGWKSKKSVGFPLPVL